MSVQPIIKVLIPEYEELSVIDKLDTITVNLQNPDIKRQVIQVLNENGVREVVFTANTNSGHRDETRAEIECRLLTGEHPANEYALVSELGRILCQWELRSQIVLHATVEKWNDEFGETDWEKNPLKQILAELDARDTSRAMSMAPIIKVFIPENLLAPDKERLVAITAKIQNSAIQNQIAQAMDHYGINAILISAAAQNESYNWQYDETGGGVICFFVKMNRPFTSDTSPEFGRKIETILGEGSAISHIVIHNHVDIWNKYFGIRNSDTNPIQQIFAELGATKFPPEQPIVKVLIPEITTKMREHLSYYSHTFNGIAFFYIRGMLTDIDTNLQKPDIRHQVSLAMNEYGVRAAVIYPNYNWDRFYYDAEPELACLFVTGYRPFHETFRYKLADRIGEMMGEWGMRSIVIGIDDLDYWNKKNGFTDSRDNASEQIVAEFNAHDAVHDVYEQPIIKVIINNYLNMKEKLIDITAKIDKADMKHQMTQAMDKYGVSAVVLCSNLYTDHWYDHKDVELACLIFGNENRPVSAARQIMLGKKIGAMLGELKIRSKLVLRNDVIELDEEFNFSGSGDNSINQVFVELDARVQRVKQDD